MASLVLVGSGDAGRGVVEACDKLGKEREGRLSCIVDGGDLVPWWVEGEEEGCRERRQLEKEQQQVLWGGDLCNDVERCGPLAQRWSSSLLVISAQLDVAQYTSNPCPLPLESEPLTLAWRGGVVALAEARALEESISLFVPNCPTSRPLLAGHWNTSAPVLGSKTAEEVTLREVVESWLRGIHVQAVDPVAEENLSCQQGPSAPLTACRTGFHCAGWTPSYAYSGYSPKLTPPTYLFPSSYSRSCTLDPYWPSCTHSTKFEPATQARAIHSHEARSHLHPVVSSHAVGVSSVAAAEGSRRERLWQKIHVLNHLRQLYKKYKNAYAEEYHGIGEAPTVIHAPVIRPTIVRPQVITPVVERPTIIRPTVVRPNVLRPNVVRPNVVRPTVVRPSVVRPSVVRRPVQGIPPVLTPDYEYDYSDYDHSDYPAYDYYDYSDVGNDGGCGGGCSGCANGCGPAIGGGGCQGKCAKVNPCGVAGCQGNLFARIVKAAREKRRQKGRRGGLLKELVEALERENIDYEDFGRTGRNLEQGKGKKDRQRTGDQLKRL